MAVKMLANVVMRVKLVVKLKPPPPPPVAASVARAEHRFYSRLPVNYRFLIYFNDPETGQRCIPARTINMSKSGALVETAAPIAMANMVYVKVGKLGLMGLASVRHCTVKGSKFRIGLYFPNPLSGSF
jgi:hypothetical protein